MSKTSKTGVSLSISARNSLSYVNFQAESLRKEASNNKKSNYFSFLRSITITNSSEEDLRDLTLSIVSNPSFLNVSNIHISEVAKGPRATIIDRFDEFLDYQKLYMLTESLPAALTVTLNDKEGKMVAVNSVNFHYVPLEESAATERADEILASFVTPNEPVITDLISKALDYKKEKYGSGFFDAYLSKDPNKVLEDVDAIYMTLKSLGIRYVVEPASYERLFQRVRLPRSVIADRLGNCLDISLLFLSCLEAIGLKPLLIFGGNHALVGFWLEEKGFVLPLEENVQTIINEASEGYETLALIEPTAITEGNDLTFQEAKDIAYKKLEGEKNFRFALDIQAARNDLMLPIPSLIEKDGVKEVILPSLTHYKDGAFKKVDLSARRFIDDSKKVRKNRYDFWEDKLLDLNLANKLINFKVRPNTVEILSSSAESYLSFLSKHEKVSLSEIEVDPALLKDSKFVSFKDSQYRRQISDAFSKGTLLSFARGGIKIEAAKALSRKSNTSLEESGCNPLFLTIGLIRWFENDVSASNGTGAMYAPIFLLPVKMPRRKVGLSYPLEYSIEEIGVNSTAFEYFKQYYDLDFSSLNELPKTEDGNLDIRLAYNEIRRIIGRQKNWLLIEDSSYLSLFSFSHFVMWSDLKNNRDRIMSNSLVSSFVFGEKQWVELDSHLAVDEIDEAISPKDLATPLSADSSQIRAIWDSLEGESFILDGPPGTGKSQTIANMIVNFLFHGKKVLFVAEKEVALDVVKKRLDELSLGRFVLELTNIQEPKSKVLETYSSLLKDGPIDESSKYGEIAESISLRRDELNKKLRALHSRKNYFLSAYEAIVGYLDEPDSLKPFLFPSAYVSSLMNSKFERIISELDGLAKAASSFRSYSESSFLPCQARHYSLEYRDELAKALKTLLPKIRALELDVTNLLGKKGILKESRANAESYFEILSILRGGIATWPTFYNDESFLQNYEAIDKALLLKKEWLLAKEKILSSFEEQYLRFSAESLKDRYSEAVSLSFFKRRKALRSLRKELGAVAKAKEAVKGTGLKESIDLLLVYEKNNQEYQSLDKEILWYLKSIEFAKSVDYDSAKRSLDGTAKIAFLLQNLDYADTSKAESFATYLSDLDQGTLFSRLNNKFVHDYEEYLAFCHKLQEEFSFDISLFEDSERYYSLVHEKINEAVAGIGRLSAWASLLESLDRVEELCGTEFISLYKKGQIKEDDLVSLYRKSVFYSVFTHSFRESDVATLSSQEIARNVELYKKDLEEFVSLTIMKTASKISENYPIDANSFARSTMANKLAKLAKNGGRGTSLRYIFKTFKDLIVTLTPCFMMSPISVAQFLDIKDYQFDVVIFDEASQIPTSEAIGAIARGKSVVIAGDEEQMPPSSYFTGTIGNSESEAYALTSLNEDLESLLDDAIVLGLPRKRLTWHYRSRHESLIAFSNNKFYENSLLTFPSPRKEKESISFRLVKSSYERGRGINRSEAKEVVAEIIRRLADKSLKSQSIGVVTFNEAQQNLVEDLLEKELAKNPSLNLDPGGEKIFVKNLENVQGDERDVILFSVTYGADRNGTISLNFGPLSLKKGERRLNVAVSRAREEMIVFSSLNPEDIKAERAKNAGASYLRDFLSFAKYGYDYLPRNGLDYVADPISFSKHLAADLRKMGYSVKENIGESTFKIDLAIADPKNPLDYVLGIILDNETVSSLPCSDRNINEPEVLRKLGWNIYNVYSVEYLDHKEEVLKDIVAAINLSKSKGAKKKETSPAKAPLFVKKSFVSQRNSIPYLIKEYEAGDFLDQEAMRAFLLDVIETEGPISRELLNARFRDAYKLGRVGSRSKDVMEGALRKIENYTKTFINGGVTFFAPIGFDELRFKNYRLDEENKAKRTMSDIPFVEIANCASDILLEQGEMLVEDLAKEVSDAFSFKMLPQSKKLYAIKALKNSDCKYNGIFFKGDYVCIRYK